METTPAARAAMDETGGELRMMAHWKQQQRRDVDSSSSATRLRCWQPGEVEVEDRWGIGSMSPRPPSFAPPGDDRFHNLKKLASRQLQGSRRLQQAGHRLFSCFRHSTLNLRVQHTAPSTPPKSGPLPGQRTSISSIHGVTFKGDALDLHTDRSQVLNAAVEPTSPVVNCMGQVISNKTQKHGKLNKTDNNMEMEMEMENINMDMDMDKDMDKLRRTKSQSARGAGAGAPSSPPGVWRSKSCKWKQLLLRSNSSSISPSFFSHPACEGDEPQIDLCRFSSATASSEPFYRQNLTADNKRPDKTCLFMQSMQSQKQSPKPSGIVNTELSHKQQQQQQQQQLDVREHGINTRAEAELVVRNLPKLKTKRMESPKWLADEPALQRRQQGLLLYNNNNNNKPSLKKSSETSSTSHA